MLYVIGLVTALLTAYYMTRQVVMVFFGEARWLGEPRRRATAPDGELRPHEPPPIMLAPHGRWLGAASLVGGGIQLPFWLHDPAGCHAAARSLAAPGRRARRGGASIGTWADDNRYLLLVVAAVVAVSGIAAAWLVYQRHRLRVVEPPVLQQAWYCDRAISDAVGGPGRQSFEATAWFDRTVVDGGVNGLARSVRNLALGLRRGQSAATSVPPLASSVSAACCCSPGS